MDHSVIFWSLVCFALLVSSPALNIQTSEGAVNPLSNLKVQNPQLWTSTEQNVKIVFSYQPQKPILDQPTELNFLVQNLKTGDHLTNLIANVLVTYNSSGEFGGYENTKFSDIKVVNGQFSLKYLFEDTGLFEIITRISGNGVAALAPFKVIVPIQPYPR
jgi:hypothetical protein